MKKELNTEKPGNEPVVIADECGDSIWDAVLQQELNACEVTNISKSAAALLNAMAGAQVSKSTEDGPKATEA